MTLLIVTVSIICSFPLPEIKKNCEFVLHYPAYLSVTLRAVIDQFRGRISSVRPAKNFKYKAVFVVKTIRNLSPSILKFYSK